MKRFYSVAIILILAVFISGFFFSSVSKTGKTGDDFYKYLKINDYEAIIDLLDKDALKNITEAEWLNILKLRNNALGKSFNYTNTGFHTSTVNKNNITQLDYTIKNGKETIYESIDLIKRDGGFKIVDYRFNKMYSQVDN